MKANHREMNYYAILYMTLILDLKAEVVTHQCIGPDLELRNNFTHKYINCMTHIL